MLLIKFLLLIVFSLIPIYSKSLESNITVLMYHRFNSDKYLELKLATVFRDDIEKNIPSQTTLNQKNSNIFINVNQIKTQVVFCDLFSKKVEISFQNSQNNINNTQMFLLVKTNEENMNKSPIDEPK